MSLCTVHRLVVFHVAVEAIRPGTTTLPALVVEVRGTLGQNAEARDLFEDLLLDAGYLDRHEPFYTDTAYAVRTSHTFDVKDSFPRLTESSLPAGVGDLTYSVVISSCMPFVIEDAAFRQMLRESGNA